MYFRLTYLNRKAALPKSILMGLMACNGAMAATLDFANCRESSVVASGVESPNRAYFQNLLARGTSAPLKDFLRLWNPGRVGAVDTEAAALLCREEEKASIMIEIPGAPLSSGLPPGQEQKCLFDTVYSWGPAVKLNALKNSMPDNDVWRDPPNPGHTLNTSVSAVGSYGYGEIPVRIKLKPSIIPPPTEYIVRSGNEIESWSFGTPEHYDEIVRDLIRYQSKKPWVGYWVTGISNPDKQDSLFFPLELDGHQFSQAKLKAALLIMIRMILRNEGRIYYSAGVCRNRELAFETRFPTYVNPFPDPKASEFIRNQFTPFSTKASTTEEIPNASSAE